MKNQALQKTMLTEFFSMNKYDNYAKNLNCMYAQFPEYFRWNQQSKIWEQRKQREVIGRILGAHPSEGERYYLRILLMHVRKPTSFTDLRTVNGRVCASFHEATDVMGLLQTDNAAELWLSEAVAYQMPNSLRQLFAAILVYCSPKNPAQLWLQFQDFLSEDIK
ncbi:uncharacterized protein [Coffea arabica]|uniref:Uncharacterized protein n=1 Tax=Coffea arabica TaxID=13443 RepID=A0ABM4X568_COFAR